MVSTFSQKVQKAVQKCLGESLVQVPIEIRGSDSVLLLLDFLSAVLHTCISKTTFPTEKTTYLP